MVHRAGPPGPFAAREEVGSHYRYVMITVSGRAADGLVLDATVPQGQQEVLEPEDIDFSRDVEDFAAMTEEEQHITCVLASQFMAGEESVTQDLQPFMQAMAAEGRLADEASLARLGLMAREWRWSL